MTAKTVPKSEFASYTVGWICALPQELAAARAMFDDEHGVPESDGAGYCNAYRLGRIGAHNVVSACLPAGVLGATPAATVAMDMQQKFEALRFGLLVGVGSGAPSADNDIRLGDVVVSRPTGDSGGVIEFERALPFSDGDGSGSSSSSSSTTTTTTSGGRFVRSRCLNAPPTALLTALANLEAEHILNGGRLCAILAEAAQKKPRMKSQFAPPLTCRGSTSSSSGGNNGGIKSDEADQLYEASYVHQGGAVISGDCGNCDRTRLVRRLPRESAGPQVHYGAIASGNEEIACGVTRDAAKETLGVLCFDREAAGLMNNFPCLAIRGISGYADTHRNNRWLGYAAATSAACAKELLESIPPQVVQDMATIKEVLNEGKSFLPLPDWILKWDTKSAAVVYTIVKEVGSSVAVLRDADSIARQGMSRTCCVTLSQA